jgi:predicted anti-sigma-YlaC factor YlaD
MPDDTGLSCQELIELVTDFFEGVLDPDTRRRVEEHLALCEGCRVYVEQMRDTLRVLGTVPPETLEPVGRERLLEAFRGWSSARQQNS